jgi:hypothetical protein
VVDWSVVQGFSVDDRTANYAKCWLLIALLFEFVSIFFGIYILVQVYTKSSGSKWAGIALVLQNFLIAISAALFRWGRNEESPSI